MAPSVPGINTNVNSQSSNGMTNGHTSSNTTTTSSTTSGTRPISRSANDRIERFPPSPATTASGPLSGPPSYELFSENTRAFVYGLQPKAVQGMLDFDFICRRKTPSVAGIIYPFGGQFILKQYWGTKETLVIFILVNGRGLMIVTCVSEGRGGHG